MQEPRFPAIDWLTVLSAAAAGLIVVIPAALVLTLVLDEPSAGWVYLFGLVIVFGFLTAGYGAGRARSDTPMIHGAIAALLCYAVVQGAGTARRLVAGDDVNPLQYPFLAALATALGVSGALFADWYRRRSVRGLADRYDPGG